MTGADAPLIFLMAGEPSGDLLGARLMAALKAETGGRVRFAGIGGDRMAGEGLDSLFPIDELAVMGLVEVLPHALRIYRRIRQTTAAAVRARPDALVTIDSPGFTLRVSRRLKGRGFPLIHYVAPSVWAWKAWRARQVAGYLDLLLTLLPFEPPYFEAHGLAARFVGHPALEAAPAPGPRAAFRKAHGIPDEAPLLCLLPGSRQGEVRRLAPVFGETLVHLMRTLPALHAVVPTVRSVAGRVAAAVRSWPAPTVVVQGQAGKSAAFAACDAALAASGTVSVELAAAGLPAVLAYRVNWLTGHLAAHLLKVPHVGLPSLVLGREVQPELLQQDCTAERLAPAVARLLSDPAARQAQIAAYREVLARLRAGEEPPSRLAARQVLAAIDGSGPI